METWLEWARGPAFRFAVAFLILGLIRHLALTVWEIFQAARRAGDKSIPYAALAVATLKWLFPVGKMGDRLMYGVTTAAFHVSVLIVPVFLIGHIDLWRRGVGLSWPGIPNGLADVLTVVAIATALALVVERLVARDSRALSRFQDFTLPLVIALPFASGFLLMHPSVNPFSFETMMFLHVMSANLVFVLIPITKLSHCVLLPTTQVISEAAWHFTPDGGSKVAAALGKENEAI